MTTDGRPAHLSGSHAVPSTPLSAKRKERETRWSKWEVVLGIGIVVVGWEGVLLHRTVHCTLIADPVCSLLASHRNQKGMPHTSEPPSLGLIKAVLQEVVDFTNGRVPSASEPASESGARRQRRDRSKKRRGGTRAHIQYFPTDTIRPSVSGEKREAEK